MNERMGHSRSVCGWGFLLPAILAPRFPSWHCPFPASRCDTLIRLIEKELEDAGGGAEKKASKPKKAEPASRDGSVVPTGGEGAAAGSFSTGRKRKLTAAALAMAEGGGDGLDESPGGGSGGGKKAKGAAKA